MRVLRQSLKIEMPSLRLTEAVIVRFPSAIPPSAMEWTTNEYQQPRQNSRINAGLPKAQGWLFPKRGDIFPFAYINIPDRARSDILKNYHCLV